ncbi:hypothetical protein GY45DRAFT_1174743 [Cubamyces sp. BRFM 1775]|nr:hypothetical protein GY45DRAFT_1174743 [Cubamyces sp. BRFM 1775]
MSSGPSVPLLPKIPALDNTYGVMMLGTFIGLILYGVNLHQSYRYVRSTEFKFDSIYVKTMVTVVLLLETLHSVTSMHTVYYYVVKNYFNPLVLFHGVWSINLLSLLTGMIIAVCQSFFARRLWMINHKFRPLVAFVALLLMAEAALSAAVTVEAFIQPDIAHFENYSWMVSVGLGVILLADGLLTTLLIITLRRSRTGFHSTEQMLNTLITYTICTGLLTDTLTILSFAMAVKYPHTLLADGMNITKEKRASRRDLQGPSCPPSIRPGTDSLPTETSGAYRKCWRSRSRATSCTIPTPRPAPAPRTTQSTPIPTSSTRFLLNSRNAGRGTTLQPHRPTPA